MGLTFSEKTGLTYDDILSQASCNKLMTKYQNALKKNVFDNI